MTIVPPHDSASPTQATFLPFICTFLFGAITTPECGVFADIIGGAFTPRAGMGGLAGIATVALVGARRAALVNEAGVGTASMMHGASKNDKPIKEGLVAMLGPSIDSGLVCTLTALAILIKGDYAVSGDGVKGLEIALNAFGAAIPATVTLGGITFKWGSLLFC